MKEEVKEKLKKELNEIDVKIRLKEHKIKNNPPYLLIEETLEERYGMKGEIDIKLTDLKTQVYHRYGWSFRWGYNFGGHKFKDIKPSVKQGIKEGLGVKSIKGIEDYLVKIVKNLIERDLNNPKIKELEKKVGDFNEEIEKLKKYKDKLIDEGLKILKDKRIKIYKKMTKEDDIKEKELVKKKAEVEVKVNNLSQYMENIVGEVNKRLILDSI